MSVTPLELAKDVLELIGGTAAAGGVDLPVTQWAQLGTPVMTCDSVAVGILATREVALYDGRIQCGALLQSDVTCGIVRECSIEHDNTGHTVPEKVEDIASQMELDSGVLSTVADLMAGKTQGASLQYSVEGGLAVVSMVVTSEVVVW